MIDFPKNFETFLLRMIKSAFYRGTKRETFIARPFGQEDLRFFAKGVSRLSDLFTTEREAIDATYLNAPDLQAGYLLYFLPINFAKAAYVYAQFPAAFWERKKFRVLDLGAGPGSAGLAFAEQLKARCPGAELDVTLVDQNKNILGHGEALLRDAMGVGRVRAVRSDLRRFRGEGHYDLVVLSHTLNEMRQAGALERAEWLGGFLGRHLAEGGLAAVLEPALKRPTRELMALRDHLLTGKELQVLAPCLHQEICPMLKATRNDWCHFYIDWNEPEFLRELDRLVGNENRFLKVAYLVLGRAAYWRNKIKPAPQDYRIVSNQMATRGKIEVVLCGPAGRIHLTRLDRDAVESNADFNRVRRGDVVEWKSPSKGGFEVDRQERAGKREPFKIL